MPGEGKTYPALPETPGRVFPHCLCHATHLGTPVGQMHANHASGLPRPAWLATDPIGISASQSTKQAESSLYRAVEAGEGSQDKAFIKGGGAVFPRSLTVIQSMNRSLDSPPSPPSPGLDHPGFLWFLETIKCVAAPGPLSRMLVPYL